MSPAWQAICRISEGAGLKILIAEDSPTQAERLRHVLQHEGYEVAIAANGRIAWEMTGAFQPALIISDVVMPEMDGYELSRRVKADPLHRSVPIILVTTMSDPEDVLRGLECGADNFVIKPYEPDYLLSRVRYALANPPALPSGGAEPGLEIDFNGVKHVINADREQILNLLLSTYDAAVERNKQLQRSREQLEAANAKLNEANSDLEAFSYSASHDLRAPLRHISGYSAMVVQETEGRLSPKAARCLEEITGASRRMARLIEDLLQFSRMERASMQKARVEVDSLVRECISELDMATPERKVVWEVAPLPGVVGDAAMLRQVFSNLLGNAVKYTARSETAVVAVGTAAENEGEVTLFVRDNGAGFDMKYADKLFKPFQRLHGPDEFEGTGIGLATVRRVVARHGGRVWAEATPGSGATFYVTLSRAK